jgi:hypothetical protein
MSTATEQRIFKSSKLTGCAIIDEIATVNQDVLVVFS